MSDELRLFLMVLFAVVCVGYASYNWLKMDGVGKAILALMMALVTMVIVIVSLVGIAS